MNVHSHICFSSASKLNERPKAFETDAEGRYKWTCASISDDRGFAFEMDSGGQIKWAWTAKKKFSARLYQTVMDCRLKRDLGGHHGRPDDLKRTRTSIKNGSL